MEQPKPQLPRKDRSSLARKFAYGSLLVQPSIYAAEGLALHEYHHATYDHHASSVQNNGAKTYEQTSTLEFRDVVRSVRQEVLDDVQSIFHVFPDRYAKTAELSPYESRRRANEVLLSIRYHVLRAAQHELQIALQKQQAIPNTEETIQFEKRLTYRIVHQLSDDIENDHPAFYNLSKHDREYLLAGLARLGKDIVNDIPQHATVHVRTGEDGVRIESEDAMHITDPELDSKNVRRYNSDDTIPPPGRGYTIPTTTSRRNPFRP